MRRLYPAEINAILGGTMLVIDPSSGAKNSATGEVSLLGWASFENGKLVGSGTIIPDYKPQSFRRLRAMSEFLREDFEYHDMFVQEDITTKVGHKTLIQACGGIVSNTKSKYYFEPNIRAWQSFAQKMGGWTKGDESDAQYMGWYMIAYASGWDSKGTQEHKEYIINRVKEYRDERDTERLKAEDGRVEPTS